MSRRQDGRIVIIGARDSSRCTSFALTATIRSNWSTYPQRKSFVPHAVRVSRLSRRKRSRDRPFNCYAIDRPVHCLLTRPPGSIRCGLQGIRVLSIEPSRSKFRESAICLRPGPLVTVSFARPAALPKLRHPSIVSVHEIGDHEGQPVLPFLPPGRLAVWGGAGGSLVLVDADRRLTFAYVMNKMVPSVVGPGGGGVGQVAVRPRDALSHRTGTAKGTLDETPRDQRRCLSEIGRAHV